MLTRAAALSAMTLVVPAKLDGDDVEEQRHAQHQVKQILRTFLPRGKGTCDIYLARPCDLILPIILISTGCIQSLKQLSAVSLAKCRLDPLMHNRAAFLPRELHALLGSLGFWVPAAGLDSPSSVIVHSGFSFMQFQAVKGMCRLAIRQKREINGTVVLFPRIGTEEFFSCADIVSCSNSTTSEMGSCKAYTCG